MSSLTDSEEEEQHPGFGQPLRPNPSTMAGFKPGVKRKFDSVNAEGDARSGSSMHGGKSLKIDDFVKKKTEGSAMSEAAKKMMERMGHKAGEGLGKHGQGRTQIVEASTQRGRRGLGMVVSGLEPSADLDWDFTKEEIIEKEPVDWLPRFSGKIPSLEEMESWIIVGPKKREIDDEADFCSQEVLTQMLNGKNVFDELEPEEMRRARTRSNPYETIRSGIFLNRAAMKMANMDAALDFMFTNPRKPNGESLVEHNELLYFCDICAGPGGFSEYVLWRKKGESKGFGLTLKGSNDFKLEDFFAGPPEMFEPHYGVGGVDGDGDIFNPANQKAFIDFVLENTNGKGAHFVMADGGFSVEGQENIQEILSKQLYLCQFLVAVAVLREGGHFVCKLFDLFTPFSVGLVYLMNMIFEHTSIFKPVTSRPANSERYIVCKNLKASKKPIQQYMHDINVKLCKYMSSVSEEDINHVVPLDMMLNDKPFYDYMVESNENFAKLQAVHLKKIEIFTRNSKLYETRQSQVRQMCLKNWQVPDRLRRAPGRPDPNNMFHSLLTKPEDREVFHLHVKELNAENLHSIKSVGSYMCYVRGEGPSFYILGCGRYNVFRWDGRGHPRWQKLDGMRLELPSRTLLEVQAVTELKGEGKGQRRHTNIHVVEAFFLCGEDVRHLSFEHRQERLTKFVKALHKPTRSDLTTLHKPEVFPLEQIDKIFGRLSMKLVKGNPKARLCYQADSGNFFNPTGVNIVQTIKEPWILGFSKSTGRQYWFNIMTRVSVYDCPPDSLATIKDCKEHHLFWHWTEGVKVHKEQEYQDPNCLSRDQIIAHLNSIKQR